MLWKLLFVDPVLNNDEDTDNIINNKESNHERRNFDDTNEYDEINLNADDLENYVTSYILKEEVIYW